jgi:cytochrome c-type biogenesis protein CcmH/NrfG
MGLPVRYSAAEAGGRCPWPHRGDRPSHRAAQYSDQLDAIAREVQQRAIAELRAKAGLHDVTVNVTIERRHHLDHGWSPRRCTPADLAAGAIPGLAVIMTYFAAIFGRQPAALG